MCGICAGRTPRPCLTDYRGVWRSPVFAARLRTVAHRPCTPPLHAARARGEATARRRTASARQGWRNQGVGRFCGRSDAPGTQAARFRARRGTGHKHTGGLRLRISSKAHRSETSSARRHSVRTPASIIVRGHARTQGVQRILVGARGPLAHGVHGARGHVGGRLRPAGCRAELRPALSEHRHAAHRRGHHGQQRRLRMPVPDTAGIGGGLVLSRSSGVDRPQSVRRERGSDGERNHDRGYSGHSDGAGATGSPTTADPLLTARRPAAGGWPMATSRCCSRTRRARATSRTRRERRCRRGPPPAQRPEASSGARWDCARRPTRCPADATARRPRRRWPPRCARPCVARPWWAATGSRFRPTKDWRPAAGAIYRRTATTAASETPRLDRSERAAEPGLGFQSPAGRSNGAEQCAVAPLAVVRRGARRGADGLGGIGGHRLQRASRHERSSPREGLKPTAASGARRPR
jgi:hypothetical protein